MVWKGNEISL